MPFLQRDNQRVYFEDEGAGPVLIFLHGFLADHRMWLPQIREFRQDYRVIAWDAPGCGRSSDPPETFSFSDYARRLEGLLDALSIPDAHVVGLSWGGSLALRFAALNPGRLRSLTLVATYAGWLGSFGEETARQRLEACNQDANLLGRELAAKWAPALLAPAAAPSVSDLVREILSDFRSAGFRNQAKTLAESDLRNDLLGVRSPLLLIWGEQDQRSPPSVAADLTALAPHARLVTIAGAGHLPNLERAARFNQELRDFLAHAALSQ